MSSLIDPVLGGKLIDQKVVGGLNFSTDQKNHEMTVPTGKRWLLFCVCVDPDVASTIDVQVRDAADVRLASVGSQAAGVSPISFPDNGANGELDGGAYPIPLKATDYIKFIFDANQTAAATITAIIIEFAL